MRTLLPAILALSLAVPSLQAQQQDPTVTLLQQLSDAPGTAGAEDPVRAIMVSTLKPLATAPIRYDGMGSAIFELGTNGPRIMIDAHMDELGGMVRRIGPNGQLTMQMLGGWLDQALPDQRWIILGSKGPVEAVTGIRDIHVITPNERTAVIPRESIFLDIGANTPAEAAALGIEPGDPIVPDSKFEVMNGTDNYLGKAWDDRIGLRRPRPGHAAPRQTPSPQPPLFRSHDPGRNRPSRRPHRCQHGSS